MNIFKAVKSFFTISQPCACSTNVLKDKVLKNLEKESYSDYVRRVQNDKNNLKKFVSECCDLNSRYVSTIEDLMDCYVDWCKKNGFNHTDIHTFGRHMFSQIKNIHRKYVLHTGGDLLFRGIRPKDLSYCREKGSYFGLYSFICENVVSRSGNNLPIKRFLNMYELWCKIYSFSIVPRSSFILRYLKDINPRVRKSYKIIGPQDKHEWCFENIDLK